MQTSAGHTSLTERALKRHLFINKKKLNLETRENWDFEIMISSGDSVTNSPSRINRACLAHVAHAVAGERRSNLREEVKGFKPQTGPTLRILK